MDKVKVFIDIGGTVYGGLSGMESFRPYLWEMLDILVDAGCDIIFWTSGNIDHHRKLIGKLPFNVCSKDQRLLPIRRHFIIDDDPKSPPKNSYSELIIVSTYMHFDDDRDLLDAAGAIKDTIEGKVKEYPGREKITLVSSLQFYYQNVRS